MRICRCVVYRFVTTVFTIALETGCLCVAAQEASIVVPPLSVNISLNKVVEINCIAIADFIDWEVNGGPVDNFRSKGFDDTAATVVLNETQDLRMATLRVVGSPDSNGANVTCIAIQVTPMISADTSEPALILVQGLLGPVHNLYVTTINSTTVLISWSPPFTLEGVPILGYNVTITNTTSGENETVSVEDTNLTLPIDAESTFTVTVVPLNKVGAGEPATSEPFFFPLLLGFSQTKSPAPSTISSSMYLIKSLHNQARTSPAAARVTVMSTPSTTTPLPTGPAPQVTLTVVVPAVVITVVIATIGSLAAITTCVLIGKTRTAGSGTSAQDVVMVSDNPAYQQITVQRIELKENTAYHTVHHPAASPQYENISQ